MKENGSIFVQIGDENVHRLRSVLDEVFGGKNFDVSIILKKTGSHLGRFTEPVNDYILWYAKNKEKAKVRTIYDERLWSREEGEGFNLSEDECGQLKKIDKSVNLDERRIARADPILSAGHRETTSCKIELGGKTYDSGYDHNWKVHPDGVLRLWKSNQLVQKARNVYFRRYFNDFTIKDMSNI